MRQKYTITIDKNSPEAVSFFKEHIVPYLVMLDKAYCETSFIADYFILGGDSKTIKTDHKQYVKAEINTVTTGDCFTITTNEDWTQALYRPDMFNCCSEYPDGEVLDDLEEAELEIDGEDPDQTETDNTDSTELTEDMIDSINDEFEDSDDEIDWDYDKLIDEYKESDKELKGVCSIRMIRVFDETCPGLSSVEYWDSANPDKCIKCGHEYPYMTFLKCGKAVLPEEIPDKMWHGLPVNIEMFRFDGYMDANSPEMPNRSVPYSGLKPISKELADKYQPTPEYVDEIEKKLGKDIYVELGNNGSSLLELDDYYADTYTINDNVDSADTSGVLEYINTIAELAENVERSNDEFLDDLGFDHDDTMITAFAVYYSDDNDILQAFYDTSEQQFVYTLFQPGSSDNTDLTQED